MGLSYYSGCPIGTLACGGAPLGRTEACLPASLPPTRGPESFHVLLVEDYPNLARLLSLALDSHGYNVSVAHDRAEALALARAQQFDIVVSDLRLPDGDGCELFQTLRKLGIRHGIAVSGSADGDDVSASRAAGFSTHFVKPLDPDDLHIAIQRTLQPAQI